MYIYTHTLNYKTENNTKETYKLLSSMMNISIFNAQIALPSIALKTFQLSLITFSITWTRLTSICKYNALSETHKLNMKRHLQFNKRKNKMKTVITGKGIAGVAEGFDSRVKELDDEFTN